MVGYGFPWEGELFPCDGFEPMPLLGLDEGLVANGAADCRVGAGLDDDAVGTVTPGVVVGGCVCSATRPEGLLDGK